MVADRHPTPSLQRYIFYISRPHVESRGTAWSTDFITQSWAVCGVRRIRPRAKMAAPDLGSVVASVQILGRRAILGGVSLGCRRFLPVSSSDLETLDARYIFFFFAISYQRRQVREASLN